MLPVDHSLAIRKAVISHLLASTGVTDKVSDRVYGIRVPDKTEWDFVRYGVPDIRPFEASEWGGTDARITVHAHARGPDEAACANLAAAVVEALSSDTLPLADGLGLVSLDWEGTQTIPDGDAGTDFHAIIEFSVVTTAE
jgi:hypothetical protein